MGSKYLVSVPLDPTPRCSLGGHVFKLDDVIDNERSLIFRGSDGGYLIFEAPSGYLPTKALLGQSAPKTILRQCYSYQLVKPPANK